MPTSRAIGLMIWIVASIFYAYQYMLRVMPSIMLNDIMQQYNMNTTVFGQFSGIYYIGYTLMHLPIGIMLDRFGPKKVMSSCILITVLGLLPIIFSNFWVYPIMGRALVGMGSSAAILGTFKIIRMSFSEKLFPRMLSLSVTIGLIGAIYGGEPVNYMTKSFGYKSVIEIFAIAGVLLAAMTYFIVPEMKKSTNETVIADVKKVLGNGKVIWFCIFAGLMVGPLEGFADVWGTPFFKQIYGFDSTISASLPSMIFIGMCFGAPILNLIAEKTNNYLGTIISAGIIMAIGFLVLITGKLSATSIAIIFVIIGICCAYQILAIYKASTFVPENVVGLTTAVANMIIMSFGYAFHTLIGIIINKFGGLDSSQAFVYGISIIPFTLIIGVMGFIIISIYIKRKNKKIKGIYTYESGIDVK